MNLVTVVVVVLIFLVIALIALGRVDAATGVILCLILLFALAIFAAIGGALVLAI